MAGQKAESPENPRNVTSAADERFMQRALELAKKAEEFDEVPVGAVVVLDGQVVGEGCNRPISNQDPTAHAEIGALRAAATMLENYRLPNAEVYVTLEPCTMCVGAMIHARIARIVFGAREPRAGAIYSQHRLLESDAYNHQIEVHEGVLAEESSQLLTEFFKRRR